MNKIFTVSFSDEFGNKVDCEEFATIRKAYRFGTLYVKNGYTVWLTVLDIENWKQNLILL